MKPRFLIVIFVLCQILAVVVRSQTAEELGLALTGKVESIEVINRPKDISFRIRLRMTFENKGREPVILINPALNFGTGLRSALFVFQKVSYPRYSTDTHTEILTKYFDPVASETTAFREMVRYFDGERPPENFTIILNPNETLPFNESFTIELAEFESVFGGTTKNIAASRFKDADSRQWAFRYFSKYGLEYDQLQLGYEFSFMSFADDPEFLEKLSLKWKRFGRPPVGQSGTYLIGSAPIKRSAQS